MNRQLTNVHNLLREVGFSQVGNYLFCSDSLRCTINFDQALVDSVKVQLRYDDADPWDGFGTDQRHLITLDENAVAQVTEWLRKKDIPVDRILRVKRLRALLA